MQAQTHRPPVIVISAIILIAFGILAYMDSDTKGIADVFELENIVGLAVYFAPTFLVCLLLYRRYKRKNSIVASIVKAAILGIPLTFVSIIVLLIALKRAGVV